MIGTDRQTAWGRRMVLMFEAYTHGAHLPNRSGAGKIAA